MAKRKQTPQVEMPFLDHLEELRWRLIRAMIALGIGMILCFFVAPYILEFLKYPASQLDPPLIFQFLKVQAIFIVYIEIGFFGGLTLTLPYLLFQIWSFVSPGLMPTERKYFLPLVVFSTGLFLIGLTFAFLVILPIALEFFVGLAPDGIEANIAIDLYIGFAIRIMFLFGLIFELPMVCYFLAKIGLLTDELMRKYRRHGIVAIFIIAALLTPPDPVTQVFLGVPLVLLYEFSIYIVAMVVRKRKKREAVEEARYQALLEEERRLEEEKRTEQEGS
ncbi:MAG: twin-arginine translocase subunit TatC [Calditrichaeota bacterium]|nr:twin-arginine translocase subunit TatC [Calditrichota bacterium]MCB0288866.1 twin-arginine translocase subunit TatC [Calditrichota bacterium]MCB0306060.1 twin-arginine translocase subunit TatC [Calditrichota bacterium]MCB9088971.1 twin-arginine translocase subunit TatC [Calditrichia bacterium]